MQLKTKHFGIIDIDEKGIIDFPKGLPGFEDVRKYVLLSSNPVDSPFRWLQSIDKPELAFAVVDPFAVKKDYDIEVDDSIMDFLEVESQEDILVFCITVVPEDITRMTMNLKAPLIINGKKHKGAQVVLDTDEYSVRHYILEELRKQEVGAHAGSDKEKRAVHCNR